MAEIQGELSRFDFHVVRFMNSEAVLQMSDAEVGQLILLLCHAWLLGKRATLPNDPEALARWARTTQLSPLVMAKFVPIETEWGPRIHNERLSDEWIAATERRERYSQRGKAGAAAKAHAQAHAESPAKTRDASSVSAGVPSAAKAHGHTNPYQTESDHVSPSQSSSSSDGHRIGSDFPDEKEKRKSQYHWARFARVFEIYFGVKPTDSATNRRLYFERCVEFTERGVLSRLIDSGESHLEQNGGNWEDPSAAAHNFLKTEIAECLDFIFDSASPWGPPKEMRTFHAEVKPLFEKWFGLEK
jgi:uncharacterized protein YdaU (DUF1376 family)